MVANVSIKRSMHVQDAETQITLKPTALTSTRRAEHVGKSVTWRVRLDLVERRAREARVAGTAKTSWNCGETGHTFSQCPMKKDHAVEDLFDHNEPSGQPGHHHGCRTWQRE